MILKPYVGEDQKAFLKRALTMLVTKQNYKPEEAKIIVSYLWKHKESPEVIAAQNALAKPTMESTSTTFVNNIPVQPPTGGFPTTQNLAGPNNQMPQAPTQMTPMMTIFEKKRQEEHAKWLASRNKK